MRALRVLLVIAIVLGGLFVAADRVGVMLAEDQAAGKIKSSQGVAEAGDVSVDITGFPFLTQVASKDLTKVDAHLSGITAGSGEESLRISEVNASFHDVRLGADYSSAVADRADGTATVSYDELSKAAGKGETKKLMLGSTAKLSGISYGGPGRVNIGIRVDTPMGGKTVTIPARLSVEGGTVRTRTEGTAWDKFEKLPLIGGRAEEWLREITDFKKKIGGLPDGLALDKVQPTDKGVEFTVTGKDVNLTG
ncbi:DUF2993 domain-containing protein [Streptomyces sp. ODS28]|uniref:LmeA family phospholipid-binding protein n=1 Tax=Streptomyces sp. ODS28 TaxID=3136688 RepID=UPI0031ECF313